MTIARKLWLGFGVLILIFLLASLTILLSEGTISRGLREIMSVEEPTRAAAYEMQINTVEIGRDVRVYLLNGDPRYREEFAKDQAEFEEFNARYDELADTRKGKELGDRIDTLYGEYVSLGEVLMDKKDEQGTVSAGDQEEFLRRQNELESLLDEEVLPWTNQQLAQAEEDASAAIRNVYMIIVGLILSGLLVGALSTTLINRGIVGGIRKLREGADRIGRGELDHRIDLDTSDEIGAVAAAFNDMLDKRREANAALRESEERLRGLSDATFEGISISENGRVLETNRAFAELFGYERNEVVGMDVLDFVAPESRELVRQKISSRAREPYEIVGLKKDGGQLEIEVRGKTSTYRDRIVRVTAVRDVTERKEAERRLREAEERYRTLVENAPVVVYMDRLDEVSSGIYTSPQAEEMFGYPVDEWLADPELFVKLLHPEDKEAVLAEHLRTDETGEKFDMEYRLISRDGRVVWVRDESVIVQGAEEPFRHGVLLDVTERKEAERRLQEAEARYRTLVEQIPAVVYIQDIEHNNAISYIGPQIEDVLGYSAQEYMEEPKFWIQTTHPEDRERVLSEDARTDATREPFSMEYRKVRRDGRVIWVRDEAVMVEDVEGRPLYWQGIFADITERKRAEEALRESEERYRAVMEQSVEPIYLYDTQTKRVLESNAAFREMMGYTEEELLGMEIYDFIAHERENIDAHIQRSLEKGRRRVGERLYRHKDGSIVVVDTSTSVLTYRGKTALCAVSRDVTELRRAEEALRRSEASLAEAQRIANLGNWEWDVVTGEVHWSDEVFRIYGYMPKAFVPTLDRLVEVVHPEDRERLREAIDGALYRGEPYDFEHRVLRTDGEVRVVHRQAEVVRGEDGEPLKMVGTVHDITERKRAEEALRESEERHRRQAQELELLHQVRTALAQELELTTVFRAVVETIARTYGYTQVSAYLLQDETLVLQHQVGYERVLDRIPVTRGIMGRAVRTRQPVLLRDVRSDPAFLGAIEGITSEVCVPLLDEGEVAGTLNVESVRGVELTEDDLRLITALAEHVNVAISRARLYTRVRKSEERFRSLVQNASDIIIIMEADRTIRYISPAVEQVLGYKPEAVVGKKVVGKNNPLSVHPDDMALAQSIVADATSNPGSTTSAELRLRHTDGSWRCIESRCTSLLDDPSVNRIVINARDITERKKAEEEIREANRHLEELAVLKADFTAMVAHELDTPLAVIRGYADMLATGELDLAEESRALDKIQAETDVLEALVSDVRAAATVEREDFAIEPRRVRVGALLKDATTFAETLPGNHRLITESVADGQVRADAYRIGQVLRNLLSNAAKYSPDGAPIELRAMPGEKPGRVRIEVADQGAGIHPDDAARIFEKFSRGRDGSGRKVAGTGLGLYLSGRILQAHGSELTLDPAPGGGSVFGFELEALR